MEIKVDPRQRTNSILLTYHSVSSYQKTYQKTEGYSSTTKLPKKNYQPENTRRHEIMAFTITSPVSCDKKAAISENAAMTNRTVAYMVPLRVHVLAYIRQIEVDTHYFTTSRGSRLVWERRHEKSEPLSLLGTDLRSQTLSFNICTTRRKVSRQRKH